MWYRHTDRHVDGRTEYTQAHVHNWLSTKIPVPDSVRQQDTLDISWRVNLNSAKRKVILICYHNTHSASWVKCNRQEVLKSPQTFTLHHSFPHFSSRHIPHLLAAQIKMWSCPLDRTTHPPAHQEILLVLPSNTSGVQLLLTPPLDSLRSLLGSKPWGPRIRTEWNSASPGLGGQRHQPAHPAPATLALAMPPTHQELSHPRVFLCFKQDFQILHFNNQVLNVHPKFKRNFETNYPTIVPKCQQMPSPYLVHRVSQKCLYTACSNGRCWRIYASCSLCLSHSPPRADPSMSHCSNDSLAEGHPAPSLS